MVHLNYVKFSVDNAVIFDRKEWSCCLSKERSYCGCVNTFTKLAEISSVMDFPNLLCKFKSLTDVLLGIIFNSHHKAKPD